MNKTEMDRELTNAMKGFGTAYNVLKVAIDRYEQVTGTDVNYLPGFVKSYPFDKSFDELAVDCWVHDVTDGLKETKFKVLNYQYVNTGGNTMVGVFEVWLPEEKRTVYALTNEEGCTLSVVDYIRNELDVDDYDDFHIDVCDWGRLTGYEDYFELYRHCLNVYTKDDCRFFDTARDIQLHLLSDELKAKISDDYHQWLLAEGRDSVMTDGVEIMTDPDYEAPYEDEYLRDIKCFRVWHDNLVADDESLAEACTKDYRITFANKSVRIPFNADTHSAIELLLHNVIKEW